MDEKDRINQVSIMKKVCVVTGGGSGIGLAAACQMPKDMIIVVSGRTMSKLDAAVQQLSAGGHEAHPCACDTSVRESVRALATFAKECGQVTTVINAAGLSPSMAKPEQMIRVNALGTMYVNQEFAAVMYDCGVIIDISSNSAHLLPSVLASKRLYRLAEKDEERFVCRLTRISNLLPKPFLRAGLAYAFSKNFAVWYAQKSAFELGERHIRVVSLCPGLIDTGMGQLEASESAYMLKTAAEHRMGTPDELGFAIASIADPRNGYLTGVDILCDGGSINGRKYQ